MSVKTFQKYSTNTVPLSEGVPSESAGGGGTSKNSPPAKGEYLAKGKGRGYTTTFRFSFLVFSLLLLASSCKKESNNPYDDPSLQPPPADTTGANLTPGTFQYLHFKVFKPTCANSGCHDGTFEPDFRTVSSSYNSLVYQPVIKNDANYTYTYRVLPYNADLSVLKNRLTVDIDGVSGIMPLVVDPTNTDWPTHKNQYIQDIVNWINDGAKDMFGNVPQAGNQMPQAAGVLAFVGGTGNGLSVDPNNVIQLPAGTASIDILFAITDDSTSDANIGYNKFKFTTQLSSFDTVPENSLVTIPAQTGPGFYGTQVDYTRKASINTAAYPAGTVIFVRIYVKDEDHSYPAEIPSNGTSPDMVNFFCIKIT